MLYIYIYIYIHIYIYKYIFTSIKYPPYGLFIIFKKFYDKKIIIIILKIAFMFITIAVQTPVKGGLKAKEVKRG